MYDKEDIKAMIRKRGATLRQIGLNAGLCIDVGSNCLHRPVPSANQAISDFLGIPLHELWPSWYDESGRRIKNTGRQKRFTKKHTIPPEVKQVNFRNDLTGKMDITIQTDNENKPRSDDLVTNDDGIMFFRGLMIAGLLYLILWPILITVGYGSYIFIRMIFEMFQV